MVQLEDSIVFLQLRAAVWLKKAWTVRWFNQEWSQNTQTISLGGEIGSERSRRLVIKSGQVWITSFLVCLVIQVWNTRVILWKVCPVKLLFSFLPSYVCSSSQLYIHCTVLYIINNGSKNSHLSFAFLDQTNAEPCPDSGVKIILRPHKIIHVTFMKCGYRPEKWD